MSVWKYLFDLEKRRKWYLRKMPQSPLRNYYQTPFPPMEADWKQVDYLALDFETTGLDHKRDQILSIGYTTIRGQTLSLKDATHILTKPTCTIPESSAVVHGIMDDEASSAQRLKEALPILLNALAGKVMLVHYAAIECNFLNSACKRIYGYPFICPVVDTLDLEGRQFKRRGESIKHGDLRLANTRDRYGLPRYPAHNALIDAIAAGELFLAQAAYRRGEHAPTLEELVIVS
ncbi:MAG: exonuclease domain-containing protein [Candidatus Sedimenticola sp. (ex Thyasira tokunagai)]